MSVVEAPAQTVFAEALAVTDGKGFTLIVFVVVFEQLFASVPVTVYVFVDEGLKLTPLLTPPVHA